MINTKSKLSLFIGLIFVMFCTYCFLCQSYPGYNDSWRERTFKRMNEDISDQQSSDRYLPTLPVILDKGKKYYIFSDFHRGNGGEVDYFNHNRKMISTILRDIFYDNQNKKETSLILAGDIEECWAYGFSLTHGNLFNQPMRDLDKLIETRRNEDEDNIFYWEKKFNEEGRYYRIFGNHDDYWKNINNVANSLLCRNNIKVYPGIVFRLADNKENKIFITHGCQGQKFHDVGDSIAPLVKRGELYWYYLKRKFKKPGERLRYSELEEAREKLNKQEKHLVDWAEEKNLYLITGHSHQPYINREKKTCIHEREIDNIENRQIPTIEAKLKMLKVEEHVEIPEISQQRLSLEEKIKVLEIHLNNKRIELGFLKEDLSILKRKISIEGDRKSLYFDDGCCFAANIISAIELVHKDDGIEGEGWYIYLVCWDIIDEKKALLETDTYNEIKKKTKKRILGYQKLNL